jgi:hypothetical protein
LKNIAERIVETTEAKLLKEKEARLKREAEAKLEASEASEKSETHPGKERNRSFRTGEEYH